MDYNKITKDELIYDINTAIKLIDGLKRYINYKKTNIDDKEKEIELEQIMSTVESLKKIYGGIYN
jgi:predicted RNase H-like nuclease